MSHLQSPTTRLERCDFLSEYTHYYWADHPDCTKFDVLDAIDVTHPTAMVGATRRNSVAAVGKALEAANQGKPHVPRSEFKRVHRRSKKVRVTPFITNLLNSGAVARGVSVRNVTGTLRVAGFQVRKSLVGAVMKEVRPQDQPPVVDTANLDLSESSPVLDAHSSPELSEGPSPPRILTAAEAYPADIWDSRRPSMNESVRPHVDSDLNLSESSSLGDIGPPALPPRPKSWTDALQSLPDFLKLPGSVHVVNGGSVPLELDSPSGNQSEVSYSPKSDHSSTGSCSSHCDTSPSPCTMTRSILDPMPYDGSEDRVLPRAKPKVSPVTPDEVSSSSSSSSSLVFQTVDFFGTWCTFLIF